MNVLVTGSSGLIGSQAVLHYDQQGHTVFGIDNNFRKVLFGPMGDTAWNLTRIRKHTQRFLHHNLDIRNREAMFDLFQRNHINLVIHCAAQPSHDKAKDIPLVDFEINAMGTMNLLEATRLYAPDAPFIQLSTNKVYGDSPNELPLVELATRYDYALRENYEGIDENCRTDQSLHSLFGASKLAADVMAQEYGRYFGLQVGIFRGGCLTGSAHSGVELHGFLSYLVHIAMTEQPYSIFGFKGKQVRDQIHSQDVISAIDAFAKAPRAGEVYNLGGGRANSASILECIALIENISGRSIRWKYSEQNRVGDHICYISDMTKFRSHFPQWRLNYSLERIINEMVNAENKKFVGES